MGIGIGGGVCERVRQSMGSGMSVCWGWDVSTLGDYFSALVGVAATAVKCTLGDCASVVGLCTLRGGGVRGMQLFGVGGMRTLRYFPQSLIFGFGRGSTVVNCEGLAHRWKKSRIYVIAINCASQVIVGESFRANDSVLIPCRILSVCMSVGCVR